MNSLSKSFDSTKNLKKYINAVQSPLQNTLSFEFTF